MKPYTSKRSPRTLASLDKLFRASKNGDCKTINELLVSSSLDIDKCGNDGKSALFHAIHNNHLQATKSVLQYSPDVNKKSFVSYHRDRSSAQLISCDEPPIVTAARVNNIEIMSMLIEMGANVDDQSDCHSHTNGSPVKDRTALHFACEHHNVDMVELLLNNKADVNIEDKQKELPVHITVRCKACPKQGEILKLLCNHGSEVNTPNKIECPPLYLAAFYGCLTKVETLMLYGSDPNAVCDRESSYGSALHIAALKDRVSMAELLIEREAQLSLPNGSLYTPLQLNMTAHSQSTISPLLIFHGADLHGEDKFGFSLLAACIRNIRLDCESLARLMVYAGYDLNNDHWLKPEAVQEQLKEEGVTVPHIAIPAGRVENLCNWLREMQRNTHSLGDLCRISIRKALSGSNGGRTIVKAAKCLPLPIALQDFVLLKGLVQV